MKIKELFYSVRNPCRWSLDGGPALEKDEFFDMYFSAGAFDLEVGTVDIKNEIFKGIVIDIASLAEGIYAEDEEIIEDIVCRDCNIVTLTGRIQAIPKLQKHATGYTYVNFKLNCRYADGVDVFDIGVYGAAAEKVVPLLNTEDTYMIEGKLRNRVRVDSDGEKQKITNIVAKRIYKL